MMSEQSIINKRIVFFDGYCNLCNESVDFLIRRDKNRIFKYASLQGKEAEKLIPELKNDVDSFVYYRINSKTEIFTKSTAALEVMRDLGGWRKIFLFFLIFPKTIRDKVYDFVAKRRYKWYGKRDTCRLPTPEERSLFLD